MRLEIRNRGLELDGAAAARVERRLQFILARFGQRVGRVTVTLAGLPGAEGPLQVCCRIVVRLVPFGQVGVETAAVDVDAALDWAAGRIGPAVARELLRWRDRGRLLPE
jgi:hypothetical protein